MADMIRLVFSEGDDALEFVGGVSGKLILTDADGLLKTQATVTTSSNAMSDGAVYQSSVIGVRNIVLTIRDINADHYAQRDRIYRAFRFGREQMLTAYTGGGARRIRYRVENISVDVGRSYTYTVSLLCAEPFFEDALPTEVSAGRYTRPEFVFPFETNAMKPITFSTKRDEKGFTVNNESSRDGIGFEIRITAQSTVTNPSVLIYATETNPEQLCRFTGLTMGAGSVLTVTTGSGNKHATLSDGSYVTDVTAYMTDDSVFPVLYSGENAFYVECASGEMEAVVSWRTLYEGI